MKYDTAVIFRVPGSLMLNLDQNKDKTDKLEIYNVLFKV